LTTRRDRSPTDLLERTAQQLVEASLDIVGPMATKNTAKDGSLARSTGTIIPILILIDHGLVRSNSLSCAWV
jgi:hypothetical protein